MCPAGDAGVVLGQRIAILAGEGAGRGGWYGSCRVGGVQKRFYMRRASGPFERGLLAWGLSVWGLSVWGLSVWSFAAASEVGSAQWQWRLRGQGAQSGWEALRLYQRLTVNDMDRWSLAVLTEKDPGESSWRDLAAFYAAVAAPGGGWRFTLGDLHPSFGQGLVWGRASAFGAGRAPRQRRDSARLGRRAALESGGVRGAALQARVGRWRLVGLAGYGRWDGRLDGGVVRYLRFDGLHATPGQRRGRGVLAARVGGVRLAYDAGPWLAGATWSGLRFSRRLETGGGALDFAGRRQGVGGIDARWRRGRMAFYGEAAFDARRGYGATLGGRWSRRGGSVGVQARRYTKGFYAFFAGGPGAGTNEEGAAFEYRRRRGARHWRVYAAAHRRLRPLARSGSLRARAEWGATWRLQARPLSHELEGRQSLRLLRGARQRGLLLRWTGQWRAGKGQAALRAAARRVLHGGAAHGGGLLSGRVAWGGRSVRLGGHLSAFAVSSYAGRLYEHEPDAPGGFGVAALYGRGWRLALSGRLRLKSVAATVGWRYERAGRGVSRRWGLQVDTGKRID